MKNKYLFTLTTDLPDYIEKLKEKIQIKILSISFDNIDEYIKNHVEDIYVFPNRKYKKIFINFKNKYTIKKFCKNIIKYDNKLIIDNIELKLYPDYNTFTSVKINYINVQTNKDILYNYINNLEYIKYCFFIENAYILFSVKEDAERFLSEKHMIDNVVLDIELAKLYNEITEDNESDDEQYHEDINKKVQKQENINDENCNNINTNETEDKTESTIEIPNIELIVNGEKYNENYNNIHVNVETPSVDIFEINTNEKKINLKETIKDFQNISEKYIKEIKNNIDKEFVGDKYLYGVNMKLELNEIISKINLFKNNYLDFIEYIEEQ
jgi:hypothetical protein